MGCYLSKKHQIVIAKKINKPTAKLEKEVRQLNKNLMHYE